MYLCQHVPRGCSGRRCHRLDEAATLQHKEGVNIHDTEQCDETLTSFEPRVSETRVCVGVRVLVDILSTVNLMSCTGLVSVAPVQRGFRRTVVKGIVQKAGYQRQHGRRGRELCQSVGLDGRGVHVLSRLLVGWYICGVEGAILDIKAQPGPCGFPLRT